MIKIEKVEVHGIARAVYSARNAMNSWDKSDSDLECDILGDDDFDLACRLVSAGSDHSKFMRMIDVTMDVTAPMYWWKEADTYKVGTVRNSCSTMHKIHSAKFTRADFSDEHIMPDSIWSNLLDVTVSTLNIAREAYNSSKDKEYWWQMIQMLPSSYNQKATLHMNYQVLRNIYHARKNHKLDEWHDFCDMIETLPYSTLITM